MRKKFILIPLLILTLLGLGGAMARSAYAATSATIGTTTVDLVQGSTPGFALVTAETATTPTAWTVSGSAVPGTTQQVTGTVTAISGDTVIVQTNSGASAALVLNASTSFYVMASDGTVTAASASNIQVGSSIVATGTVNANGTALLAGWLTILPG